MVFSDRYLVPLIPIFALGLGRLIEWAVEPLNRRKKPVWLPGLIAAAILLLVAAQGAIVTVKNAERLTLPDTRTAAMDWVIQNIPAGSSIVEEQGGPDLNPVELAPLAPEPTYRLVSITPLFILGGPDKEPLETLVDAHPQWVISSSYVKERYTTSEAKKQFPELVAAFGVYYSLIENYLVEEASFAPGDRVEGPKIRIYRVPDHFWDRVKIGSESMQEAIK
jgi:hypothetical protein